MNKSIIWGSVFCALFIGFSCHSHNHGEEGHEHGPECSGAKSGEETNSGIAQADSEEHTHGDEIDFSSCQAREAGLKVAEIQPSPFQEVLKVSGMIEISQGEEVTISATSDGIVTFTAPLTEGKTLQKGATLLSLSTRNLSGGDPLLKAKVAYDLAKEDLERVEKLYDQRLNTNRDLLAARQAFEEAKLNYQSLSAGHQGEGRGITSPLAGYVKKIQVQEGEYVTQGQPLLTLSRTKRLTLKAKVPERYFGKLSTITSANFRTSYENEAYRLDKLGGKLLSAGKSADTDSYAAVYFEFDNIGNFIPGSYVEVYLLGTPRAEVLSLPREALTEEEGLYFVYLQTGAETYVKREVNPGADDGSQVEIQSGLQAGDQVVIAGAYQLKLAGATAAIPAHSHAH